MRQKIKSIIYLIIKRIESLDDLKRLVYDHTLYEMKEMSLL